MMNEELGIWKCVELFGMNSDFVSCIFVDLTVSFWLSNSITWCVCVCDVYVNCVFNALKTLINHTIDTI